tara:strand:- start:38646 stop:39236 length:591 start_codon:yes stop_codon:yes gene_type:complete
MKRVVQLNSRHVNLISGYIKNVDLKPWRIGIDGPFARIAIAINRYYPEFKGGNYFDHELIAALVSKIIGDGSVEIVYNERKISNFQEIIDDWKKNADEDDPDDPNLNEIFKEAKVKHGDKICRKIFGIDFDQFGGPEPYHDSITLEVYLQKKDFDSLQNDLRAVLADFSCKITEIKGQASPSSKLSVFLRGFFLIN